MNPIRSTKPTIFKLFGPSQDPLKFPSHKTRYSSLHALQGGAEFIDEYDAPTSVPGTVPTNLWNENIRSFCLQRDLPSAYGLNRGDDNIGGEIFSTGNIGAGWWRPGGVPPDEK